MLRKPKDCLPEMIPTAGLDGFGIVMLIPIHCVAALFQAVFWSQCRLMESVRGAEGRLQKLSVQHVLDGIGAGHSSHSLEDV